MTQSPTEGKCANPAGGLCGMPLALRLSEGLGPNAQNVERDPSLEWTYAQRCELAEKCLPKAEYRARLERLHADILAEIERLRGALAEFLACHTESAGWSMSMMADRAEFNAMLARSQDRVDAAADAARVALGA